MVSYATVDIHLYYLMEVYLIETTVVTSYLKCFPRNLTGPTPFNALNKALLKLKLWHMY